MWDCGDECGHVQGSVGTRRMHVSAWAEADWKMRPSDLGTSRALVMLSTQMVTSPLCRWILGDKLVTEVSSSGGSQNGGSKNLLPMDSWIATVVCGAYF